MVKRALAERKQTDDERLRKIFPDDERDWLCLRCEMEVRLTKDRVTDCIIDHPAIILRETLYWRCPVCNAAAARESSDRVEPIEYITGNVQPAAGRCGAANSRGSKRNKTICGRVGAGYPEIADISPGEAAVVEARPRKGSDGGRMSGSERLFQE